MINLSYFIDSSYTWSVNNIPIKYGINKIHVYAIKRKKEKTIS